MYPAATHLTEGVSRAGFAVQRVIPRPVIEQRDDLRKGGA